MGYHNDQTIEHYLSQLAQLPTVSPFCQALYQLIGQYVCPKGSPVGDMGDLFVRFLTREVRYHRQLDKISGSGPDVSDRQSLAEKRHIGLELSAEEAQSVHCSLPQEEIARQLLLAECYYHTYRPAQVVAHLEAAAQRDPDQPLIQFALGYNRYILALEAFASPTAESDEAVTVDYMSFQRACLQAAAALEKVLAGHENDRYIYQWIGRILATAGFPDAAQEAFVQAEATDYNRLRNTNREDDWPANTESAGQQASGQLPPITQAEIDQATQLLRQSLPIEDLWPDDDYNWEN